MPSSARPLLRALAGLCAAGILLVVCLLRWGSALLVADDPPHGPVDAAVVLQGSITGEKARIDGAVDLLRRGVAGRALLSVPKESYWGQSIPPIARTYLERNYGKDLADRVDFCETGGAVDSTLQEAHAISPCIREHHWQSIVIVTSNYHTRRAGMIWRGVTKNDSELHLSIEGVPDPEFRQPWWRHRQSAKIWVMESSKLLWASLGGS